MVCLGCSPYGTSRMVGAGPSGTACARAPATMSRKLAKRIMSLILSKNSCRWRLALTANTSESRLSPMNIRISLLAIFVSIATLAFGQSQTKRYLYISTPDAAQKEYRSGEGILVFDIDDGHKFVRRI